MKFLPSYLLVFTLFSLVLSCNSQTEPVKNEDFPHRLNYYVRYLDDDKSLQAEAGFYAKANPINLGVEIVGDAFFNDKKMPVFDAGSLGKRYQSTIENFKADSAKFVVKYSNGMKANHSAPVSRMDSILINQVSKSKGAKITWKGPKLDKEEKLVILMTDGEGQTITMNRLAGTEDSSVELLGAQFEKMKNGTGSVALVRSKKMPIRIKGEAYGNFITEYYSKNIPIEVVN